MSDTDDKNGTPLEEILTEAEETAEDYHQHRERLSELKGQLMTGIDDLLARDVIDEAQADRLYDLVDEGDYGTVRTEMQEAVASETLEFNDEEKDAFARAFEDAWADLETAVEQIRTGVLALSETGDAGLSEDKLITYLYGEYSQLNKSDIEAVFDAFGTIEDTSITTDTAARVLATFEHDLNKTDAEAVLEAIQQEADR